MITIAGARVPIRSLVRGMVGMIGAWLVVAILLAG